MSNVPYPQPGPYPGYPPPGFRPVKVPRPKTIKVLVTLGIVFGALVVVGIAAGVFGIAAGTLTQHKFDGGHLSVELEADKVYNIKETLSQSSTHLGECAVSGPDDAQVTLTPRTTSRSTSQTFTAYTFVTDTAGTYDFSCRHTDPRTRSDAPFVLQPERYSNDWLIAGLPLAFFVFLPTCLATLIPGLVIRSRLKRYQAMGLPLSPPGR